MQTAKAVAIELGVKNIEILYSACEVLDESCFDEDPLPSIEIAKAKNDFAAMKEAISES